MTMFWDMMNTDESTDKQDGPRTPPPYPIQGKVRWLFLKPCDCVDCDGSRKCKNIEIVEHRIVGE